MAQLKCVACGDLRRVVMKRASGEEEVYYECDRFPYMTSVGGLFRPAKGTSEAAAECPKPDAHCLLCDSMNLEIMGLNIKLCLSHGQAWSAWLDKYPEKREFATRRGYGPQPEHWLEVFREWVEEARKG